MPEGFYIYRQPLNLLNWDIDQDSNDVILGYPVKRAVAYMGGRLWEAWFSPDLPFSEGPYKFSGLPGLIMKVKDARGHYEFTINSLTKDLTENFISVPQRLRV